MEPLEFSPEAFTSEEERLLDGDPRLASSKVGAAPWNRLLSLYKRLQKGAMAKGGLPREEPGEEEEAAAEEDSGLKLCVPGIVTCQFPLLKAFRSTDTVGFVEAELKKLLEVQRESRLWKMGGYDHNHRELLTQPEITLEEAGVMDGQHLLLEEMWKLTSRVKPAPPGVSAGTEGWSPASQGTSRSPWGQGVSR